MQDEDFEEILDRFSRHESRSGGQISEDTATLYRSKARDFREWLTEQGKSIEEADFVDIEDWYAHLDDRYNSASPVNQGKGALRALFGIGNNLADAGRINIDPWGRETPADRANYTPETTSTLKSRETHEDLHWLTPEEVDRLADNTERLRDELIVRLLFQTGCRVTELCDIRWPADVDRGERAINIRGKGRKNRTVYYQPSLDFLMEVWIEERRPATYYASESEYLFPTSHSEQITRQTVEEVVRETAERADLQETYGEDTDGHTRHTVTPHTLRHSFAQSALNDRNWDIYTLSQALGHEDTEITTSTYLHDDEEQVRKAYQNRGPSTSD